MDGGVYAEIRSELNAIPPDLQPARASGYVNFGKFSCEDAIIDLVFNMHHFKRERLQRTGDQHRNAACWKT